MGLRRLWEKALWKLGVRSIVPELPSRLMIEPTNTCNLRCPACPTGTGKLGRPPRTMSFEEFRGVVDQALHPAGYLDGITLFNYGEPFLCRDLLKMVRYASEKGLATFTSTNGHFFTSDDFAGQVVESGLTELVICLDGADQETISRYRRKADFEEILEGIRRVMRARERSGRSLPVVELQFILMKHNQHQRERMRLIAAELGVDRFIEKTVGISAVDPDFRRLAGELLPDDLAGSRYERLPDGEVVLKGEPPRHCEWVNSTMLILSNGDVAPCCYDVFSNYIMGNVFHDPLKAIWRGDKMRAFRRRVATRRQAMPICAGCPEGRTDLLHKEPVGKKESADCAD